MRRILVATAPVHIEGETRPVMLRCMPAVLFWHGEGEDMVSIIVKASMSTGASLRTSSADGGARPTSRMFVETRPWCASSAPPAPGEKQRVFDFLPAKDRCDVLLTGHVDLVGTGLPFRTEAKQPTLHANVMVRTRGASLSFTVASPTPGRIPMSRDNVMVSGHGDTVIGPRAPTVDPACEGFRFAKGFNYGDFQLAHPRLQTATIQPGDEISIEGVAPEPLIVKLPDLFPRAVIDWTRTPFPTDARLQVDTIHIDLDADVIDLTWRGFTIAGPNARKAIDRVVIGFAADRDLGDSNDPKLKYRSIFAELPRGTFQYAWEIDDVLEGKAPPPIPEEEHEMARYEALANIDAPAPTLTIEEHAVVAAELLEVPITPGNAAPGMEERLARTKVLEAHGFDDFTWSLEERAHADRLASVPADVERGLHVDYAKAFVAAQENLKHEELPTPKDYAALSAQMSSGHPKTVLYDAKLTLGAWMRIDREYQKRMAKDEKLRDEVDRYLESEMDARGEPPVPEIDEEGLLR